MSFPHCRYNPQQPQRQNRTMIRAWAGESEVHVRSAYNRQSNFSDSGQSMRTDIPISFPASRDFARTLFFFFSPPPSTARHGTGRKDRVKVLASPTSPVPLPLQRSEEVDLQWVITRVVGPSRVLQAPKRPIDFVCCLSHGLAQRDTSSRAVVIFCRGGTW